MANIGPRPWADIVVGRWGGSGGVDWDDGAHSVVKEIRIVYGDVIDSISTSYEDSYGNHVQSKKHGGNGGSKLAEITLNTPDEHLQSVHGYISSFGGKTVISSLKFKSNRQTFGPYGPERGTPFAFPMEGGKIVGFIGRSGLYLDAIGFHVAPV